MSSLRPEFSLCRNVIAGLAIPNSGFASRGLAIMPGSGYLEYDGTMSYL